MEELDLGVCRGARFAGDEDRFAVILPGARYGVQAPLLWFAREALQAAGWTVLALVDEWRGEPPETRAEERFAAGMARAGDATHRMVVAKSLSTLVLPRAASAGLAGVWLTPLLNRPAIRVGIEDMEAPCLLVGGTADPTWDGAFAAGLSGIDVLEIPGADHSLQYPGDPKRSLDALRGVTERIGDFVARV